MIRVERISKTFGRVRALADVSLEVGRGERVAFVGSNGSGKTTLLRAMLGLVRVEGRVTVAGVDVAREPEIALRNVAYIPQIAPPADAPTREVVGAVAALRRTTVERVGVRAERLGLDLDACAATRFRDLSGGTKQKLLAALALAAETEVLLCDEPTANLDAHARAAFFEEVDARPAGHVLVLCSHRVEEVRQLVHRVVELKEGRVERDTPLDRLLETLRTFRVEVTLRPGGAAAEALLVGAGFGPSGPMRFGALCTQSEKVAIVARLVREHADAIADLSMSEVEDLRLERPAADAAADAPKLRLVKP
ncbi:MAG: ABC transporter ATP-binding protein [Polyangiaceae bacterium]|nr:ABC transporter ATP-binding protein [Polyangiaceae bacterium]